VKWHTAIIPVHGRWRQLNQELEVTLGLLFSSLLSHLFTMPFLAIVSFYSFLVFFFGVGESQSFFLYFFSSLSFPTPSLGYIVILKDVPLFPRIYSFFFILFSVF
jgi:hypothetical protein